MNREETALLLARIATYDNRQVEPTTIAVWFDTLGHLDYYQAVEAVTEHFRTSHDYLAPVHVAEGVRRIRAARAEERSRMVNASHGGPPPVSAPPWLAEAEAASRRAKDACAARGYGHGHPVTVLSCERAAEEVQNAWEREHGPWTMLVSASNAPDEAEVAAEAEDVMRDLFPDAPM